MIHSSTPYYRRLAGVWNTLTFDDRWTLKQVIGSYRLLRKLGVGAHDARRVIWDTAFFVGIHPPRFHIHREERT